ncbi:MAG: hypothetical protein HY226_03220 [Candidatus Vogelbacteria bacterium]|nr:hypothetical protein [Candidatus Vogelbacteria bacterium]
MDPIWINTVVLHKQPHWDEAVALFLLRLYGAPLFHGIREAKVVFWNAGSNTPDGRSAAEWEAEGYLLVGVGGGRFDEHPTRTKPREQEFCAATLVAKCLGIKKDEAALRTLLAYTYRTDATAVNLPGADRDLVIFGIANVSKMINRYVANGDDQKALDWMMMAVEAYYGSQMEFIYAKQEFEQSGTVTTVQLEGFQQPLKISAVVSDNTQMGPMLRSKEGNQSAVVIQKNSKGQVQIHTNKAYKGLKIFDVARYIRVAEFLTKTPEPVIPSWNELAQEQAPEGVEEWFFQHSGQMLLNGSLTNPDAKPTALSLRLIVELVVTGLKQSGKHQCGAVCNCESADKIGTELCETILGLIK